MHGPPRPPWARENRTGRFGGPPVPGSFRGRRDPGVGAAVGAALFQLIGAKNLAGEGRVLVELRPGVWALLLVGPVALLLRRRYPVAVFAITAAASTAFSTVAEPHWFWAVAPTIALFHLACGGRRTAALVSAGVAYGIYLLIFWGVRGRLDERVLPGVRETLLVGIALVGAIFLGGIARIKREQMAQMMKVRAERERAEEEQQKRQASEERLRIARELHDVIGHHLSLINVQAGVGLHLMDSRPEQAREALSAIKTASSEALREVRSVLGALRTEGEAAPRQPALGLSRLDDLTADAGLPVETRTTGEARTLPAEVDRAAYRIVQEALTNVRRHAGAGATASVGVDYLPTALHLAIRNRVVEAPVPVRDGGGTPGTGIAGMRARAQSLGGTLEAGPVDGGFLVSVLLPTGEGE